ncbi:MAG: hypothetical protein NT062_26870 [Proteobacteria bacterium]|nr:hypothetical protein [Pseudomonadota bacterium]
MTGACGNKADLETARHSVYDADFAVVYSAVLEATRDLYPSTDDLPGAGTIKTAWHQVPLATNQDDMTNSRAISVSGMPTQTPGQTNNGMSTRLTGKKFFVRFDVSVTGGRPWRVKVQGHASEWEPGAAMPSEMRGMARPHWLDGRIDALTLAIFSRIKSHAVRMKETPVELTSEEKLPKTDPTTFAKIPAAAATRLAHIKDMASRRDYGGLHLDLADDVKFSLGADGNADVALAMWQADPEVVDAISRAIGPTCATDAADERRVMCPGGVPKPGTYQLILTLRGTDWKLASFFRAE